MRRRRHCKNINIYGRVAKRDNYSTAREPPFRGFKSCNTLCHNSATLGGELLLNRLSTKLVDPGENICGFAYLIKRDEERENELHRTGCVCVCDVGL